MEALELGAEKTKERKIPLGLKAGDRFDLAGTNWTILDIKEEGYLCLADSIGDRAFDSESNNWTTSALREYLNTEFVEKISDEIGEENIIKFDRDLISLDGQTEYENCLDSVSLLTVDEYRKYRQFIPNTDDWWWLASPWSTPCNNDETWEVVVSPSGDVGSSNYDNDNGVRPFCIKQTVRVGNKPKSEKDTKKYVTFPKWVNTKVLILWMIKMLSAILRTYIKRIAKQNPARDLMEVVLSFKQ